MEQNFTHFQCKNVNTDCKVLAKNQFLLRFSFDFLDYLRHILNIYVANSVSKCTTVILQWFEQRRILRSGSGEQLSTLNSMF